MFRRNKSEKKAMSFPLTLSLLLMMAVMMQFGADNITPSLPAISQYFDASNAQAQHCVGYFMLGLGLFQFIFGPLSDRYGRKPIVLAGFIIFCVGVGLSFVANTMTLLLVSRFIQGAGLSSMSLFRSMIRDLYDGKQLAKVASILVIACNITPALAPITGGYIQTITGSWQMNFVLLLVLGVLSMGWFYAKFEETLPAHKQQRLSLKSVLHQFKRCFTHRQFICYAIVSSMAIGSILVFSTLGSFIFQHGFGFTASEYGWVAVVSAIAVPLGGVFNTRLLNRHCSKQLLTAGSVLMLLGSTAMLIIAIVNPGSVFGILLPMATIYFGMGFIFANAFALAYKDFGDIAGVAGSVYGGIQMLGASAATLLSSAMPHASQLTLACFLVMCNVLLFLMGRFAG